MNEKEKAVKLLELGEFAVKTFLPKDGNTYCNVGVQYICKAMGLDIFKEMMANEIVDKMVINTDFSLVAASMAQELANQGHIVIAGLKEEVHGHVACVMPGNSGFSGKWQNTAPLIANCGKTNGIMTANWGFGAEPKYFAWLIV